MSQDVDANNKVILSKWAVIGFSEEDKDGRPMMTTDN